ncbi:hypothetical protein GH856_27130 [Bacillus thuringiensis]|nr:hypothetical protein [Bacillus thuringiensis]
MRQTFKAKDEDTLWQLETQLRGLGFKWNSGKDSHVKNILEKHDPLPAYIHVYTGDRSLTWSTEYGMSKLKYPVDATFETGQSLFMDSDGSVHIYEVSKPLDEQPKEPEFRFVQVGVDEVLRELARGTYYYEEDGYDGLLKVYVDTRFKMGELAETRFFRREEV